MSCKLGTHKGLPLIRIHTELLPKKPLPISKKDREYAREVIARIEKEKPCKHEWGRKRLEKKYYSANGRIYRWNYSFCKKCRAKLYDAVDG